MKLTKDSVKRLKPNPDGTRRDHYLNDVSPGLGVRVSETKSIYFVQYRAPGHAHRVRRRAMLGDARLIEPVEAIKKARAILHSVDEGVDPAQEKRHKKLRSTTVADMAGKWVEAHKAEWRPSTLAGWQRFLDKEILPIIGQHFPAAVTREDVLAIVDRIKNGVPDAKRKNKWKRKPAPVSAARCYETIRRMFKWAISRGIVTVSPCVGIEALPKAKKGTRTYTNDELRAIFAAIAGTQVEHLLPLVTLCATRSGETRSARWSDLDLERAVWRIPPERSKTGDKTGDAHDVPLSESAVRIGAAIREANLKARVGASDYLFPATADRKGGALGPDKKPLRDKKARREVRLKSYMGKPNRTMEKLGAATGIEGLGLHNIRRTVATRLSQHGTRVEVIEHVLGHALPKLIRTYQLHVPMKEMREALDWWADELARILGERPAPKREEARAEGMTYQRAKPWTACSTCGRKHPDTYAQCPKSTALQSTRTFIVPPQNFADWFGRDRKHGEKAKINEALERIERQGISRERLFATLWSAYVLKCGAVQERELEQFREALVARNKIVDRFDGAARDLLGLLVDGKPFVLRDRERIKAAVDAAQQSVRDDGFFAWSPKDRSLKTPRGRPDSWRHEAGSLLQKLGVGTRARTRLMRWLNRS